MKDSSSWLCIMPSAPAPRRARKSCGDRLACTWSPSPAPEIGFLLHESTASFFSDEFSSALKTVNSELIFEGDPSEWISEAPGLPKPVRC